MAHFLRRGTALLVGLMLLPGLAAAEYFVCGDATGLVADFYDDPTAARAQVANCFQIPKATTAQQVGFIHPPPSGRRDYIKVEGGLAVEKTQGEKDALDAAIAAALAARQVLADELTTSTLCNAADLSTVNARLATMKSNIDAQIEALAAANLATLKTSLHAVVDLQFDIAQKTVRCLTALRRVGGP